MTKRLFYQQSEPGSRVAATAQRLSVKARIMMALFALMLIPQGAWAQGSAVTNYALWIGNYQVTSDNNENIAQALHPDSIKVETGGSISFDPSSNTLILNNVELKREITSELPYLIIRFSGSNKVNTDASNASRSPDFNAIKTSKATATLKFEKSGDGLCTLELNGRSDISNSAVRGFSSVSYGSGDTQCYLHTDVPTTYGEYRDNYGPADNCYSNFSKQYEVTSVVTISSEIRYPLWIVTSPVDSKQVTSTTITDGVTAGSVTFTPATGTTSSKLTLSSATLDAKILSGLGNLVVEVSGSNKINSSDSGTIFRSINEGELTIEKASSDAVLELEVFGYDNHPAIQGFHTLSYNSFVLKTSETAPTYGIFHDGSSRIYGLYDAGPGGDYAIKQATFVIDYGLSIAGTPVTSANAGNVFAGTTNDGKVTFLPDANTTNTGTLKLNGLQITGDITSGLAELTIEISGDNTLHASSTISEDGHIIGTATAGTLTFTKASGATGTSSLVLNAANSYSVIQGFTSVTAGNDVYFQYGNPYEYNTTDKKMAWLNGSPVQGFLVTTQPSYPLWIDSPYTHGTYQAIDGNVSVAGDDIPFTVSGTTYTLTLNNKNLDYQHIISGLDNLTIELVGTNTMNDSDPTVHSDVNPIIESLNNSATLTFKKSGTGMASLEMSNDASGSSIISGFNSVDVETGLFWTASGAITYDSTNGLLVGTTPAHNATIGVQSYPLWVGTTQLTSSNAGNVFNDGTVSYVHDATNNTGTLTLNGATLSGDISTSMSDLTIHVKGNNKITAASNCIRSSATTPGKLTFTKDTGGKLELASNGYSVIKGFNDVDGVPLETKAPYEIYTNGDYYRLKQLFVAAGDTASIDNVWVYADTTYPLWVDGHQATSVSANNILGDAGSTASFNSNTLTLNLANITGAIVSSLTSTLTISVKGNSTVSGGIFQTSNATAGLVVAKDAAATGNVSLLVNPGREAAISGFSSFTYTDFAPLSTTDGTTNLSDGISYESNALKYNGTALGGVYLLSKTDLATAGLTFTMASVAYTGAAVILPTTATMDDGTTQTTLTQTTDYTITGYKASDKTALPSAPVAAGNYYATIQGNGKYTGTADAAFTIDQADFSKITLTIGAITAQTYTGSEIKPTPTVTFAGTQLVPNTDFDYSYSNNINAALSTATPAPTVTLNGKGNFTGTNNVTFTIDPKSVVGMEVNVSGTYTYTGSAIQPTSIEVKDGSKTLTVGTDYNITSYSNNTNAADANDPTAPPTVTITGIGNYTNSTSGTFTILDRTPTIAFNPGRTYMTFYDANETFLVPNNVTAYVVTGVSGSSVTLRRVYYISAGNPVLLESTPGVTTTVDKTETYADNYLRYGTGAAQPKHYVLYNNEFVKATGDLTNKVYLDATTLIAGARTLTIDRNNSATAIEAIVEEAADGDQWYDMQGRKINKPTKDGLYIKNGKKVVVNNK